MKLSFGRRKIKEAVNYDLNITLTNLDVETLFLKMIQVVLLIEKTLSDLSSSIKMEDIENRKNVS